MSEELLKKLYQNYKSASNKDIRKYLSTIKIIVKKWDNPNRSIKYYTITESELKAIKKRPREYAVNWIENHTLLETPLIAIKDVPFVCKSSSRFFLKADIGEVFDQLTSDDLINVDAISINTNGYTLIDGTNGEHFLMSATLYSAGSKLDSNQSAESEAKLVFLTNKCDDIF